MPLPEDVVERCSAPADGAARFARPMTPLEFSRFSELISGQCGIKLPPTKKVMLEARLQKRLRALKVASFRAYYEHLRSPEGRGELEHMLNAVTTNKTDFFREPGHFRFLTDTIIPSFLEQAAPGRPFRIWSAGCSTGEEPYTLAMVLADLAGRRPDLRFTILATDISTKVLDHAREAVYDEDRTASVPPPLKQKFLLRSRDRSRNLVRMAPALRAAVQFQRVNLMEDAFASAEPLDAIFCRNVIIYFDRNNQERLLTRFCRVLRPGGYLFLGHSESIHGFDLPLTRVTSTVHRRSG